MGFFEGMINKFKNPTTNPEEVENFHAAAAEKDAAVNAIIEHANEAAKNEPDPGLGDLVDPKRPAIHSEQPVAELGGDLQTSIPHQPEAQPNSAETSNPETKPAA